MTTEIEFKLEEKRVDLIKSNFEPSLMHSVSRSPSPHTKQQRSNSMYSMGGLSSGNFNHFKHHSGMFHAAAGDLLGNNPSRSSPGFDFFFNPTTTASSTAINQNHPTLSADSVKKPVPIRLSVPESDANSSALFDSPDLKKPCDLPFYQVFNSTESPQQPLFNDQNQHKTFNQDFMQMPLFQIHRPNITTPAYSTSSDQSLAQNHNHNRSLSMQFPLGGSQANLNPPPFFKAQRSNSMMNPSRRMSFNDFSLSNNRKLSWTGEYIQAPSPAYSLSSSSTATFGVSPREINSQGLAASGAFMNHNLVDIPEHTSVFSSASSTPATTNLNYSPLSSAETSGSSSIGKAQLKRYHCSVEGCKKSFSKLGTLQSHIKTHGDMVPTQEVAEQEEKAKPFVCEVCQHRFSRSHGTFYYSF